MRTGLILLTAAAIHLSAGVFTSDTVRADTASDNYQASGTADGAETIAHLDQPPTNRAPTTFDLTVIERRAVIVDN